MQHTQSSDQCGPASQQSPCAIHSTASGAVLGESPSVSEEHLSSHLHLQVLWISPSPSLPIETDTIVLKKNGKMQSKQI